MISQSQWQESHAEKVSNLAGEINSIKVKLPDAEGDEWENLNDQLEELETEYYSVMQETYDDYRGDALYERWKADRDD